MLCYKGIAYETKNKRINGNTRLIGGNLIEFDNISMAYPNATDYALKNVSFKIENGEFVFLIGKSGSGKSTILKLMSCEERPNSGKLIIDDINIHSLKRKMIPYLRRSIGLVFQDFRLIPSKTVYENIAFAMQILGASKKQIRRRVSIVLSIVGLKDKEKMLPSELSGGEQQRVAIARAIVNNPMLLIADEPTGNLDPANSESIMAILNEINRNGTTVMICTHDYNLVNRMRKRVIEIDKGYVVRDESQAAYTEGQVLNFASPVSNQAVHPYSEERLAERVQKQKEDMKMEPTLKETAPVSREPYIPQAPLQVRPTRFEPAQKVRVAETVEETLDGEKISVPTESEGVES